MKQDEAEHIKFVKEFSGAYKTLAGSIINLTSMHSDGMTFSAVVMVAHFLLDNAPDENKAALVTFLREELKEYV